MVEVFRTADVPKGARTAYWNEVYSSRFAPVLVEPNDQGRFQAELKVGALGSLEFACVRSRATAAERRPITTRDRMLGFLVVVRGSGAAAHRDHETALETGDILLTDSTERMRTRFGTPMQGITVRAPEAVLRRRIPQFDKLRGRRLPAKAGLTDMSVAMARGLSAKLDGVLSPACAAKASCHLLDVLATACSAAFGAPFELASPRAVRRARINAFIEDNLGDPDLSANLVAEALRISPRYLRKLMAEQGETASSFIRRRRLEECARELSNDIGRARSITDVAYSWGFNSTAHFARVFKSTYGVCPREYRPSLRARQADYAA